MRWGVIRVLMCRLRGVRMVESRGSEDVETD
ncbi:hypothetical protein Pint_36566 [Pistacia integerrima]|uniref:Uncharacterized protein n=1 Tax=Pistacia integerrima TaxID=434235 RepID=A0ACC0XZS7_9ROSI|nr:hypothetical protein Pint_36566 [Pistacia integerrima]